MNAGTIGKLAVVGTGAVATAVGIGVMSKSVTDSAERNFYSYEMGGRSNAGGGVGAPILGTAAGGVVVGAALAAGLAHRGTGAVHEVASFGGRLGLGIAAGALIGGGISYLVADDAYAHYKSDFAA